MEPSDVDRETVRRTIAKVKTAMPKLNAFVSKKGDLYFKVSAFGFEEIFNVDYVNKVLSDTGYQVRKDADSGGSAVNQESDEDPLY